MNDARDIILSRIRTSLGWDGGAAPQSIRKMLAARAASPPIAVRPAIPRKDPCDSFTANLEAVAGKVVRVPGLAAVPGVLIRHLDRYGLPYRLVASRDPILADIPWPGEITLRHGAAADTDRAGITGAFAAVAETGSLVLCSGEHTPTTLNFLPEDHIVVLGADRIVPYMEDVWGRIKAAFPTWPRTVNFITGPSRTGDIEQTMQLGAHGPRRLTVILVMSR
ncbi:MAG: L-lactate dehydrogenase complex protein LldG [Candidatus Kentron sp. G]|nr:MAG: L-lactate dehydrogenase complex protein LldG [Candidatus Kentron sp. G]VFM97687.1 MAG: L-lactate dehydrogenase complex protein LldG [Candidatus Kentron sp. G]VFN00312.1 MAG: L-lactate dehydrogenase complex protein LldG [Candidatus Kentron sp. G]